MSETINSLCIQQLWILGCGVNKIVLNLLSFLEHVENEIIWIYRPSIALIIWRFVRKELKTLQTMIGDSAQ